MNNQVREVLVEARAILGRGWHQGSYSDGYGKSFCIRAAISIAAVDVAHNPSTVASTELAAYADFRAKVLLEMDACQMVQDNLPEPWTTIPGWNDDEGTVHNDVLSVMDKAISACPL